MNMRRGTTHRVACVPTLLKYSEDSSVLLTSHTTQIVFISFTKYECALVMCTLVMHAQINITANL